VSEKQSLNKLQTNSHVSSSENKLRLRDGKMIIKNEWVKEL
jgi:hypothetical protein